MWNKLVVAGGLLVCLGLPAFAAPGAIAPDALVKKTIPVELKGKLQRREVFYLPGTEYRAKPFVPAKIWWDLLVDGQAYELDFDNKHDLWVLAEKSSGQTVQVKGTWDGNRLHVNSMTADVEHVKKTVKVEIKGRLQWICPPITLELARPGIEREPYDFPPAWLLYVNDQSYTLVFDDEKALAQANALLNRTVVVTGVQADDGIHVGTIKADDEHFKVTDTTVEIKGKLRYVYTMWDTGKVALVCDRRPQWLCKSWVENLGFEIDGQVYLLDFDQNKERRAQAEQSVGCTVTAHGALHGEVVMVTDLYTDRSLEETLVK
jgi:hypothetical protein